ncbi:hypothetical protein BOO94_08235 [Pseudomonas sp. FSL W5-0299]|nr:hypothetical protein BOO94_08235 [Pseudomonas sp. FSL W5-0299]
MTLLKPAEHLSDTDNNITNPESHKAKSTLFRNIFIYTILLAICAIIFTPLISTLSIHAMDYSVHLKWASEMDSSHTVNLPHPLYHLLVILAKHIFTIDYAQSSTVIIVLSIFFLAALNYKVLSQYTSIAAAIFLSICLLIVTPLQAFYLLDSHLYFGYIGISIYHSPTMLLLKPLSLLAFCYALKAANDQSKNGLTSGLALALSLFFCGISKPSFLMIVLPAFLTFLLITKKLKIMLSRTYIYTCFFLPIFTVLGLQFFQTFFLQDLSKMVGSTENHIVIMPLETMSHYSDFLLPKFFLSIAFPLAAFLFYPKQFIKDDANILSSCCFLMGAILTYFFAESGYRMYDGNFWWSGQIGLYLAFLFSLAFLLKNFKALTNSNTGKIKYAICFILLSLHAAFGVLFFKQELLHTAKFW